MTGKHKELQLFKCVFVFAKLNGPFWINDTLVISPIVLETYLPYVSYSSKMATLWDQG